MATSFKGGVRAWRLCQDLCFGEVIGGDGRRWESLGNLGLFARGVAFKAVTGGTLEGLRSTVDKLPLVQGRTVRGPRRRGDPYAVAEHGAVMGSLLCVTIPPITFRASAIWS